MCGEQVPLSAEARFALGSSPRVRGAASTCIRPSYSNGIIPACAGSSSPHPRRLVGHGDHPRVCGEQLRCVSTRSRPEGSSPRVRGAEVIHDAGGDRVGIIPACAGSSQRRPAWGRAPWDHPRVCGEQMPGRDLAAAEAGSSPRVRGAAPRQDRDQRPRGIIPACAGSRTLTARTSPVTGDHPRVCGEQTRDPQLTIAHPSQRLTFQSVCERAVT